MTARTGYAALALGTVLVVSAPGVVLAGDCDPLDAVCAVDAVDAVDPDEVLNDTVGSVTDGLDDPEETIEPVVEPVLELVDQLLGGGGIVEPPAGDGPGARSSGPGTKVEGREGSRTQERSPSASTAVRRESARPPTLIGTAIGDTRPVVTNVAPDRFDGFVGAAVRGLLLALVFFGLTVGFVLFQDRLDRNDPKLAWSPPRAETVTFG